MFFHYFRALTLFLFSLILFCHQSSGQIRNVDVEMDVIEVIHGYDCGNDATGTCCGCLISICNDPEPRWRFWGGYDGGSFVNAATFPLNGGTRSCGSWNNDDFDLRNVTDNSVSYMSVDMESWEEDGCGGDNDYNTGCANSDDAFNSRFRLQNIDFRIDPPGVYNQYGFYYGGYGYGAKVDIRYYCDDPGDQTTFGTDSWRGYVYDCLLYTSDAADE